MDGSALDPPIRCNGQARSSRALLNQADPSPSAVRPLESVILTDPWRPHTLIEGWRQNWRRQPTGGRKDFISARGSPSSEGEPLSEMKPRVIYDRRKERRLNDAPISNKPRRPIKGNELPVLGRAGAGAAAASCGAAAGTGTGSATTMRIG
jgi:hypothetical protein